MSIASRLAVVAAVLALAAACTSVEQADSPAQLPGEAPKSTGLQVPPDASVHPTVQTANATTPR